jgi:acetolactate synthase-1/3 small subunit
MRHAISVLVENRYGELARIVELFSARGYNIESLTVAETLDSSVSRLTVVTSGDDRTIQQIVRQLKRLVRVLEVTDLNGFERVERETVLLNVAISDHAALQQLMPLVSENQIRVVEVMADGVIVEATAEWTQIREIVQKLTALGIRGMARTGTVALAKHMSQRSDAIARPAETTTS